MKQIRGNTALYMQMEADRASSLRSKRRVRRCRAERIYYLKQKASGIALLIIGVIIPITFDGDATFSIIAVPLGILLIVTKEKLMDFKY